jgi:hypothetical protein
MCGMKRARRTSFCVSLEAEHNFRSSVPSSGYIFSHVAGILFWIDGESTSETKVADFELTIGVDEEVAGFEVSVEDVR